MPLSREADRERKRRQAAQRRAEQGSAVVVELPRPSEVQDAVRQELSGLPGAQTHPALVAAALCMARILDDPKQSPHYPSAARSLDVLLMRLHEARGTGPTKLSLMRASRTP
jgi:hypothetical protein